jgi:2,4-dichlorophenol 6-monooxygenase
VTPAGARQVPDGSRGGVGGAFHLLTGPGGEAWSAVCDDIALRTGLDIKVSGIGPGCPFGDPYGEWQRIRDISAVLVRPDGHVAWRVGTAGEQQLQALRTAVAGLLGHGAARTSHEDRLETVAG